MDWGFELGAEGSIAGNLAPWRGRTRGSWLPATAARRKRGIDPRSSGKPTFPCPKIVSPGSSGRHHPPKRAGQEPTATSDEPEARGSAETPGAFERQRLRAASERARTRGCPFAGPAARPDGRGTPAARGRAPHRPRPAGRAARPAALRGEGAAELFATRRLHAHAGTATRPLLREV